MALTAPKPATCLPPWARDVLDQWRDGRDFFSTPIDEEMAHRREAFYRLYTADDPAICEVWRYVDTSIARDERGAFLGDLILATDWICPDEPLPVYGAPIPFFDPPSRLRTREQRKARKLAELLQLLRIVTPPDCAARTSSAINTGTHVESLIIYFNIGQVPAYYDQRWQLTELRVEYTYDSKRGWMQHRRASDRVRHKAIKSARKLAELPGAAKHAPWLCGLADALEALPTMEVEHSSDFWLLSQKASYLDWVRRVLRGLNDIAAHPHTPALRHSDLATLANVLTSPERELTEDDIAHAVTAMAGFLNNLHGQ